MTESHEGTSVSLQELTELLREAAKQAAFDVWGQRTYSAPQLRDMYYRNVGSDSLVVPSAKPQVREGVLSKLTQWLRSLLSQYIVDDEIGNGFAYFVGGATTLELPRLAEGAIKAAAILGPERAAQLISIWGSGEPVSYRKCVVLSDVSIEHTLVMDDGVRLESLPMSTDAISAHLPLGSTWDLGESALLGAIKMTIDCEAKPAFCKPGEYIRMHERNSYYGPIWAESPGRLCAALSLVTNHRISWKTHWSDCDEARAFGLVSQGRAHKTEDSVNQGNVRLSQQHLEVARELFVQWLNNWNMDKGLGMAISRWMASKRRTSYANQFIELRIALESLYLRGNYGELGFRVANYGAWHLGADFEERWQYQEVLRRVYGLASRAVHAGEVDGTEENRNLLTAAQDLCRKGILKRLYESEEPNWNEMILGKEP